MLSARTQVVAGFKTRLELDVPAPRVAALSAADAVSASSDAVRLVPLSAAASTAAGKAALVLGGVVNNGCDAGAACDGARHVARAGGYTFCCAKDCGRSCSISVSASNGDVRASCACAATLRVDMLRGPDGQSAQHGHALLL